MARTRTDDRQADRVGRRIRGRPRDGAADAAILDATERSLASRGYEAMSIEQVAAAAGVSKPTIYLRYRSKAELVGAMIDRLQPPLPSVSGRSARDDLVKLIQMQEQWVDLHGLRLVAAVFLEQTDHPELLERFRRQVVVPARAAFKRALAEGIERGELRPGADRSEVVDALTGAYWARAWASGPPTRAWAQRLVDGILLGLGA
ncbi:MAG: TetR/AcrR family transcriptional regulator [Acidimicrobiales bacterium]